MGRGGPPAPERGVAEEKGSEGVEWEGAMASLVDKIQIESPPICSQAGKCEADMIGIHPAEASFFFLEKQVAVCCGQVELASATTSFGLPATVSRLFERVAALALFPGSICGGASH